MPPKNLLEVNPGEFPGRPLVRTPHFHCRGHRLIPGWGTLVPHADPGWGTLVPHADQPKKERKEIITTV